MLLAEIDVGREDKDGSDGHQNNNNGRYIIGNRIGLAFRNHFIILELSNGSFAIVRVVQRLFNNLFSAYSGCSQQNLSRFERQVKVIEVEVRGNN